MPWTILITIVLTVLAVVLLMNFATSHKKLERKIRHRYAIADPQYRREMSVLLGPAILVLRARSPYRDPSAPLPG